MISLFNLPSPPAEPADRSYPLWRRWLTEYSDRVYNYLGTWANDQIGRQFNTLLNGYGADLASATTITVTNAFHRVTGAVEVDTINQPTGQSAVGPLCLQSVAGFTTGVTGNIALAVTIAAGHAGIFFYDPVNNLWSVVTS